MYPPINPVLVAPRATLNTGAESFSMGERWSLQTGGHQRSNHCPWLTPWTQDEGKERAFGLISKASPNSALFECRHYQRRNREGFGDSRPEIWSPRLSQNHTVGDHFWLLAPVSVALSLQGQPSSLWILKTAVPHLTPCADELCIPCLTSALSRPLVPLIWLLSTAHPGPFADLILSGQLLRSVICGPPVYIVLIILFPRMPGPWGYKLTHSLWLGTPGLSCDYLCIANPVRKYFKVGFILKRLSLKLDPRTNCMGIIW